MTKLLKDLEIFENFFRTLSPVLSTEYIFLFVRRKTLMNIRMLRDVDWPLCFKLFLVNYPL